MTLQLKIQKIFLDKKKKIKIQLKSNQKYNQIY